MPLIVHAGWLHPSPQPPTPCSPFAGHLFLWVEDLGAAEEPIQPKRQRSSDTNAASQTPATQYVPSHPFQAPIAQVRAVLAADFPVLRSSETELTTATLSLPTYAGRPLLRRIVDPATELATAQNNKPANPESSSEPSAITLAAWQVTGLALPPLAALTFLSQIDAQVNGRQAANLGKSMLRIQHGKDLVYWGHVAKFVHELLAIQAYLPAIYSNTSGELYAFWQPVLLDPHVQERFSQLVESMPPVCRAYNLTAHNEARLPAEIVEHFLAVMVDAVLRQVATTRHATLSLSDKALSSTDTTSVAQQWWQALRKGDQHLQLPPQPRYQLLQQWRGWLDQLHATANALFRTCFVLQAPDPLLYGEQNLRWRLQYELQACDNPSLRIAAHDIWQATGNALRVGSQRFEQPQERLLAGLGAASRLFEPIAASLRQAHPQAASLSTEEAYRFLREIGPLLESTGYGVVYPAWWDNTLRPRLGLRLRLMAEDQRYASEDEVAPSFARSKGGAAKENRPKDAQSQQVGYAWDLTLGQQVLTTQEFEQIVSLRAPLVWFNGHWVVLDPEQVSAARRFMHQRSVSGQLSFLQTLRLFQGLQETKNEASTQDGSSADGKREESNSHSANAAESNSKARERWLAARKNLFWLPEDVPSALPIEKIETDSWLNATLAQLHNHQTIHTVEKPEGFVGELRPYQQRGVGWLEFMAKLGLGACLADDMGLGKTVQTIALLLHEKRPDATSTKTASGLSPTATSGKVAPALLICPTSVIANWRREIERFAPTLRVLVHHGSDRLSQVNFKQAIASHDIIVTSYGTARRDIEQLQQWDWRHLILDEAQNIKNPTAKQSQAVRQICAYNRIALTGTPVENRLSELWSILDFLNPGYLEGFERFRQRYVLPIERYNDDESAGELRRLVQPFFLRRVKSDPTIISDLPEKQEMVVYCALTEEQAQLYETTARETLVKLDNSEGIQRRGLVLALLTKLKQIANHPAHFLKQPAPLSGRSGKLERLTEMLEEVLAVEDRALIFTQFVEMGTLLQRHLSETLGADVLFLHGGMTAAQRDRMVQTFQSEDGPPIFVLSLRAGGSGLNLTRANHVFHFDRWWNPAVENQATDRAFRIGQLRNVLVHKFVVAGTLEERIHELLSSKQALADTIVGSGEDWLTELSTDELRDLLTLRREMVEDLTPG